VRVCGNVLDVIDDSRRRDDSRCSAGPTQWLTLQMIGAQALPIGVIATLDRRGTARLGAHAGDAGELQRCRSNGHEPAHHNRIGVLDRALTSKSCDGAEARAD